MREEDTTNDRLADEIRRQFASPSARRYYHSLPVFQTQDDLPEAFDDLLSRLDDVMRGSQSSR